MDTKIDQLKQIIPEKYILRQEPMKNHTTFRIGGPADIFVAPENMEEIHEETNKACLKLVFHHD